MRDVNMNSVRAIDRAIDLLNVFTMEHPELTIDEIVAFSRLPKTTAYRILYTMEQRGLIRYNPETLKYKLGLKLLEYAGVVTTFLDIRQEAEDLLIELQTKAQQTVIMAVPEQETMVYVYKRENPEGLKYASFIGLRRPLSYGVLGQVMLAYLEPVQVERLLQKQPVPKLTEHTVTDPNLLQERLEQIRQEQIYVDREETFIGGIGVGAPVFNDEGKLIAALAIIGPSAQLVEKQLEAAKVMVTAAANQISAKMGYRAGAK
jgi:IclR family KDG regulon transcriptional repressor